MERGVALITTLILGLVAFAFIGALLYLLTGGTKISGVEKRYYTALEAAKGGAQMVISKLLSNEELTCNGGKSKPCESCPDNERDECKIDLDTSSLGNYNLEAYLLNLESSGSAKIYTIRVRAKGNQTEKAEIEFVYKIE